MKIIEKRGECILLSDTIDLKIDTRRDIYIKKHKDNRYIKTDIRTEFGLSKFQKEKLLSEYYTLIMESWDLDQEEDKENKESDEGENNDER